MSSPHLQPRVCEVCQKTDDLLQCAGCKIVSYCGADHQLRDRDSHKKSCIAIRKARTRMEKEEQDLRNLPATLFPSPGVFETEAGHFWGIHETRPYMRARYGLVDHILRAFGGVGGRAHAVEVALHQLLDMLRLCRGDNMGVRDLIPALYLRLGQDQKAYDFVKWYATTGNRGDYNWGDMGLPFLDVKDADAFEPLEGTWSKSMFIPLSHSSAVALVKMRLLLDLQAIQNAFRLLKGTMPPEIVQIVRGELVGSIVATRSDLLQESTEKTSARIKTLQDQLKTLYRSINAHNPHYWRLMLENPEVAIAARPDAYSPKSREEACLMLGYNYASWAETPGAIKMLKTIRKSI